MIDMAYVTKRHIFLARSTRPRVVLAALVMPLALLGNSPVFGQAVKSRTTVADEPLRPIGNVVDQAKVLNDTEKERLTSLLLRFQTETGHQLVVVTVKSLLGEDVKDFTMRLANHWSIGRKGINDGIVILVAPHDRKARIAVGIGLEQQLPDAFCQHVMDRIMVPAFAKGQIGQGIEGGASVIIKRLQKTVSGAH